MLRSKLWATLTYIQGWKVSKGDSILTQSNDFGKWPHAISNALPIGICFDAQIYPFLIISTVPIIYA